MPSPGAIIWRGASITYGLINLGFYMIFATLDGSIFHWQTEKERKQLAAAQDRLWNLSKTPFGVHHRFFRLRDGRKLHYVEKIALEKKNGLVVFLHGFPDSWAVWQNLLSSPRLYQDTTLIAVDLPGYGGSDDLSDSTPESILEALTEFIVGMREEHTPTDGNASSRVLVVGHDWGAIITFRLAAEASALADRFVMTGAIHPQLTIANTHNRFASAKQMLHTYIHSPRSFRLLRRAYNTISPVFSQLYKSGYTFVFNLPMPLANYAGRMGNAWFLRFLHRLSKRQKKPLQDELAAEAMAITNGPSASQCHPSPLPKVDSDGKSTNPSVEALAYPPSVAKRTSTAGWSSKLRIYRDGLFSSPWTKSLETVFALSNLEQQEQQRSRSAAHSPHRPSTAGLFDSGPPGALLSPATIVYGMRDPAFEPKLGLEGMADYLVKGSQVVILDKGGHWLPLEREGMGVIEEVIAWSLKGEEGKLNERLVGTEEAEEKFGKSVRITVHT